MSMRQLITGAVVTVVIGGASYTVSQTDIIDNFASDTGMTSQQAEDYVNNIKEEDLVSWGELGKGHIDDGREIQEYADEIDCDQWEYEWESPTLSCSEGQSQVYQIARAETALGNAYVKLDAESASSSDMLLAINRIDELNTAYNLPMMQNLYEATDITEYKQTNSYNKSVIQAARESTQ